MKLRLRLRTNPGLRAPATTFRSSRGTGRVGVDSWIPTSRAAAAGALVVEAKNSPVKHSSPSKLLRLKPPPEPRRGALLPQPQLHGARLKRWDVADRHAHMRASSCWTRLLIRGACFFPFCVHMYEVSTLVARLRAGAHIHTRPIYHLVYTRLERRAAARRAAPASPIQQDPAALSVTGTRPPAPLRAPPALRCARAPGPGRGAAPASPCPRGARARPVLALDFASTWHFDLRSFDFSVFFLRSATARITLALLVSLLSLCPRAPDCGQVVELERPYTPRRFLSHK